MKTGLANIDWDRYAQLYDNLLRLIPYQSYLQDMQVGAGVSDGQIVLDAGCGTGSLAEMLLARAKIRLTGIDSSASMLKRARLKCEAGSATFAEVDINQGVPGADNHYHAVTCGNVLYAVADPMRTLREIHRVLQPGGRLVLATPKMGYDNGLIFKAHCGDTGPDEPWLAADASLEQAREIISRVFTDPAVIEEFLEMAAINAAIQAHSNITLFTEAALREILAEACFEPTSITIKETYAGQNLLALAQKGSD